ncbi:phosphoglycolate phosphatase [Spongiibacter sp. KMU-158]|uniref:Phosphoglycolate phosphatase n=1 Tax=Spongiibacter pelagi TaxID=2760804 RepID=A0A927GWX4_9GAMM|nr:HAD family hydrolase [Spongiibacter pelagi]MBD2859925.1 phosphoglycolate phosphatase [Spongiibacter pelagi]
MLKTILFDLDGTLLDTAADFTRVLNGMLAEHNLPARQYSEVRTQVSNGARAVVELGFGITPEHPDFQARLEAFLDRYADNLADETSLFEGMDTVLAEIEQRGQQWGIVTNKPSRFTLPLLEQIGLAERCAVAICPDHVTHRKPHAEPILLACSQLNSAVSEGIYIGDHLRDIESGRNAGMATIACRYGYIAEDENIEDWQADHIVDSAQDLGTLLTRLSA